MALLLAVVFSLRIFNGGLDFLKSSCPRHPKAQVRFQKMSPVFCFIIVRGPGVRYYGQCYI
jgi:hypothetical protein